MATTTVNTLSSNGTTITADALNSSSETKKSQRSLLHASSTLLHRIQNSTNFIGPKSYQLRIHLLDDDRTISGAFKKSATGQDVLDHVCKELNIVEKEYFGLRYDASDRYRYWLDPDAQLSKIASAGTSITLYFRFRFYPTDLRAVREEITRYQLFVQLCRDLQHGRLQVNHIESAHLAALILQAEQGDYDPERHLPGYVSEFKLLPKQTERLEDKIADIHKSLSRTSTGDAINELLERCLTLKTYAINPNVVKSGKSPVDVVIGASPIGILVFVRNQIVYEVPWACVQNVDYSSRILKIRLNKDYLKVLSASPHQIPEPELVEELKLPRDDGKMLLKFTCPSSTYAKHLWRHLLSQQAFYTEESAKSVKTRFSKPKIPLLTRGSTFRCPSIRVMREIQKDTAPPRTEQHEFVRYPLPKKQPRSEVGSERALTISNSAVPSIRVDTSSVNTLTNEEPLASSEINVSLSNETVREEIPPPPSTSTPNAASNNTPRDTDSYFDDTSSPTSQNGRIHSTTGGTVPNGGDNLTESTQVMTDRTLTTTASNGTLTNGTTVSEHHHQPASDKVLVKKQQQPLSMGRQIITGVLDLILLGMLLSIVVVAVFETNPRDPDWFHSHISDFRSNYYNQWRSNMIDIYQRIFH